MPQLAIAGVGAVIGSGFAGFLGLTGAQLGWMAGSMLGNALFAKGSHTVQPQMSDLRVQASTLGQPIPRGYGTFRHSGFVVFATDRRPVKNVQTQRGKGGAKSTNTYWTYTMDMAIDLGFGPGDLLQVLMNGKLIYDRSSGQDAASVIASGTSSSGFKFYRGTEDQMPDPTIEATRGAGNVSAYRGRMLAVFTNLDLGTNGQVPQFEFVTSRSLSEAQERIVYVDVPHSGANTASAIPGAEGGWQVVQTRPSTYELEMAVYRLGPGYATKVGQYPWSYAYPQLVMWWTPVNCPGGPGMMLRWDRITGTGDGYMEVLDLETGIVTEIFRWVTGGDLFYALNNNLSAARAADGNAYALAVMNDSSSARGRQVQVVAGGVRSVTPQVNGGLSAVAVHGQAVYALVIHLDGFVHLQRFDPLDGVITPGGSFAVGLDIAGPAHFSTGGTAAYAISWALHVTDRGIYAWIRDGANVSSLYRIDTAWQLITSSAAPEAGKFLAPSLIYANHDYLIVGPSNVVGPSAVTRTNLIRFQATTVEDVNVSDIILGEHALAGQSSDQVDVSDLDGLVVHGYPIGRVASARATIEPLLAAYFIDSYDAGNKRKYVRRASGEVAAWISYDELGAVEAGAEPAEPFALVHANSEEMPRSLTVNFFDKDNDYQPGSQPARRLTVEQGSDEVFDLALATTADHAATVAHVLLYNRWAARDSRKASVLRTYAFLDPSDHIMVEYPRGTWSRWVISRMTDTGAVISLDELIPVDPALYDEIVTGYASSDSQVVAPLPPPARAPWLDIPKLRDMDADNGVYVPMAGVGPGWPGGTLWLGPDDTSLEPRGAVEVEAVVGVAETALGAWTAGVFDHASSVVVQIRADQDLNSAARDDMYASEANAILLGNEILNFQDAESLGAGRWRLTGFLRGRRGTEQHRASHTVGERFVVLQADGMLRPGFQTSELGLPRTYRAVTAGRPLESAVSQIEVNSGVSLMPYSPVNLRRTRASDGAITASWDRRSRNSMNFAAGTLPLAEATEAYALVIYTNSSYTTERRVITSATPSATYTAAMQTADGVTPGAVAYARVFQISDTVGRGFPLTGTL